MRYFDIFGSLKCVISAFLTTSNALFREFETSHAIDYSPCKISDYF